ncbi:A-kinase anchor protein 12, partial [Merops nubicus]
EEPKRKVDTSVSWEAFICLGSSKKRARKSSSSSSDEETEHKLGQETQKIEESGQGKETATDAVLTSSQESDQGQGNSSPEQAGSPSEGEGISTWESFKRLVTPRRRSKTKMEERTEDCVVGTSLEHSTSDGEPGKDESWVPFRKLMPGRRKKKSDGKPEPTHLKQAREDMAETTEEDSDIPAVVPLSEYEAAEQEKIEAQQAKDAEVMGERTSEEEKGEKLEETLRTEQAHEGLVHAVSVTIVGGERAVTSIEERSPSWISAALTECIEQAKEEEEKEAEKTFESDILLEEAVVAANTVPEMRKDLSDATTASELELTSEAVTALEETAEASCTEETMEVSLAEETTEMVSAVSQLIETPDTTEEVTPVQEVEATEQNLKELDKQTQKVLHDVAERVK